MQLQDTMRDLITCDFTFLRLSKQTVQPLVTVSVRQNFFTYRFDRCEKFDWEAWESSDRGLSTAWGLRRLTELTNSPEFCSLVNSRRWRLIHYGLDISMDVNCLLMTTRPAEYGTRELCSRKDTYQLVLIFFLRYESQMTRFLLLEDLSTRKWFIVSMKTLSPSLFATAVDRLSEECPRRKGCNVCVLSLTVRFLTDANQMRAQLFIAYSLPDYLFLRSEHNI